MTGDDFFMWVLLIWFGPLLVAAMLMAWGLTFIILRQLWDWVRGRE
jgi:hypothetical protein